MTKHGFSVIILLQVHTGQMVIYLPVVNIAWVQPLLDMKAGSSTVGLGI